MVDVAFPTGYERGLPLRALHQLRQRRRRLAAQATGRVLDLGGSDAHPDLYDPATGVDSLVVLATAEEGGDRLARRAAAATVPTETAPDLNRLVATGARFDTVVSVLQPSLAPDLTPTIRALATVLAPGGRVLFLEPTAMVGFTGRAQRAFALPARLVTGRRPGRDVVAEVRAGGLVVIDVDRFELPLPWPFRSFVEGTGRHPTARVVAEATS